MSPLQRQATAWESQGRPDSLFLQGTALAEAESWATAHENELTSVERAFLDDSRRWSKISGDRRRERRLIALLACVGIVEMIALVWVVLRLGSS